MLGREEEKDQLTLVVRSRGGRHWDAVGVGGVPSNTALKERMLEIWFDLASITEVQRKQSKKITILQMTGGNSGANQKRIL